MSAVEIVIAIAEGLKKRGISMESMDMLPRVVEHTLNLSITEGFNFKEQAEQLQAELDSLREQLAAAQDRMRAAEETAKRAQWDMDTMRADLFRGQRSKCNE